MRKFLSILLILLILVGCSKGSDYVKPEVNSVYYEIYVGSFYDSDGDGMGDLEGVRQMLDYIQYDLGATGIWLMPIHPSPTYHKYDVVDYEAIDPDYGTMEDFDRLVEDMNERGMDLILDYVINHSSSQHPWFVTAKNAHQNGTCEGVVECDFYNFSNEYVSGYHKINSNLYYEGDFWSEMPDLNLNNKTLKSYLIDTAKFWLDKGVKGFRLDATTHFFDEIKEDNINFLKWFNTEIKAIKPDAYLVGEAWTSDGIILDMYESGIDSYFNFGLSQNTGQILKSINSKNGRTLSEYVANYQDKLKEKNPNGIDAVFISNHDNNRSAGYLVTEQKQKFAASIYLLMPGNPYIYYGEEVALKGSGIDENKRLPMPWNERGEGVTQPPSGANYTQDTYIYVEDALKDKNSLLNHYKHVISIRNSYPSISRGITSSLDLGNDALYALAHNEDVVIVHNLGEETIEFELEHAKIILVNGSAKSKGNTITIDGETSIVIEK